MRKRVALITGGAGGIGAAIARRLAETGDWNLALLDSDAARLSKTDGVQTFAGSVTDEGFVAETLAAVVAEHGGLDVLVNAAGVGGQGSVEEMPIAEWRRIIDINLTGTFLLCHLALPYLRQSEHAHIINIVSIAGRRIFPGQAAYCASKWGTDALTKVLAEEVRRDGIRVTAIYPGATDTAFWDTFAGGGSDHPARDNMLRPETVAASVLYALSAPADASVDELHVLPRNGVL